MGFYNSLPTWARYADRRFRTLKSTRKPLHGPFGDYELVDYYYIITYKLVFFDKNPVLHQLVASRQYHRHTHTCFKKGLRKEGIKICCFGIPFFPMDKTRLLHPFKEDDFLSEEEVLVKQEHVAIRKIIRKYLEENEAMPKMSDTEFDEFLQVANVTLENYLKP